MATDGNSDLHSDLTSAQHSFLLRNVSEAEHKGRGEERFLHTPCGQSLVLTPLITADTGE